MGTVQFRRLGLNQRPPPLQGGALPLSYTGINQGGRWESNPHISGSQPDPATALGSATELRPGIEPGIRTSEDRVMSLSPSKQYFTTPARNRTWASTFEESRDVPFTTRVHRSGGWGRTSIDGFRVRRPTVRRPRKQSVAHRGFDPLWPVRETGDLTRSRMGHESARRESNPPVRFGRPTPGPLGHGHMQRKVKESNLLDRLSRAVRHPSATLRQRKERESNPQGLWASSRFERGAIASWLALPCSVWMAGFEPAWSGFRNRRMMPGSPTSRFMHDREERQRAFPSSCGWTSGTRRT